MPYADMMFAMPLMPLLRFHYYAIIIISSIIIAMIRHYATPR